MIAESSENIDQIVFQILDHLEHKNISEEEEEEIHFHPLARRNQPRDWSQVQQETN